MGVLLINEYMEEQNSLIPPSKMNKEPPEWLAGAATLGLAFLYLYGSSADIEGTDVQSLSSHSLDTKVLQTPALEEDTTNYGVQLPLSYDDVLEAEPYIPKQVQANIYQQKSKESKHARVGPNYFNE